MKIHSVRDTEIQRLPRTQCYKHYFIKHYTGKNEKKSHLVVGIILILRQELFLLF